jgi:hypothetical protein
VRERPGGPGGGAVTGGRPKGAKGRAKARARRRVRHRLPRPVFVLHEWCDPVVAALGLEGP